MVKSMLFEVHFTTNHFLLGVKSVALHLISLAIPSSKFSP